MTTLTELCRDLDELYSPSFFVDGCPNGLQVEGRTEIEKIAIAVTASLETIEKAALMGASALIVHHGLFWNRDPYPIKGSKKEKLATLLKHDISLIAYHLPMDGHSKCGNNWKAALDLGLSDLHPFGMVEKMAIGVKGTIKSENREDFKKRLEAYYGHDAAVAFGGKESIETVALVSGGAYKMLADASGLDAFITGSYDLPAWSQAFEEKINFYALGHHATERVGPLALKEKLESLYNIPCVFIEEDNPF